MPVIAEHLGINPNPNCIPTGNDVCLLLGALGFEIELRVSMVDVGLRTLRLGRKDDGSLRNGKEYIFAWPPQVMMALNSLRAMAAKMAEVGVDPTFPLFNPRPLGCPRLQLGSIRTHHPVVHGVRGYVLRSLPALTADTRTSVCHSNPMIGYRNTLVNV